MYYVIACFPGCMPENEPVSFTNRRKANAYALDQARESRDSHNQGTHRSERVSITGRDGYYRVAGMCYYVSEGD